MIKYFFLLLSLVFIVGCTKTEATDSVTPIDNSENSLTTSVTSTFSTDMLNAVNALRAKGCNCGGQIMPPVPALKWNPLLEAASLRHAKDMNTAKIFSHTGSDGSTMRIRIDAAGYRWSSIGENIAWGYPTLAAVITGWTNSAGHCKNMMSPTFKELGAAHEGSYWVQDFGKPLF